MMTTYEHFVSESFSRVVCIYFILCMHLLAEDRVR
jgi:hypothetical protein